MTMNTSFIRFSFILSLLVIAGCAPRYHLEPFKPGATMQDFNNDKYVCMQSAMASAPAAVGNSAAWNGGGGQASVGAYGGNAAWNGGGGSAISYDMNAPMRNQLIAACLQAKGWEVRKVFNAPPPATALNNAPN